VDRYVAALTNGEERLPEYAHGQGLSLVFRGKGQPPRDGGEDSSEVRPPRPGVAISVRIISKDNPGTTGKDVSRCHRIDAIQAGNQLQGNLLAGGEARWEAVDTGGPFYVLGHQVGDTTGRINQKRFRIVGSIRINTVEPFHPFQYDRFPVTLARDHWFPDAIDLDPVPGTAVVADITYKETIILLGLSGTGSPGNIFPINRSGIIESIYAPETTVFLDGKEPGRISRVIMEP